MEKKESNENIFRKIVFHYPVVIILNAIIVFGSIFMITYCNKIDVRITETGIINHTESNQYITFNLDNKYEEYLKINDEIKWWYESNKEVNKAVIKEIDVKNSEITVMAQSNCAIKPQTNNVVCEIVLQQRLLNKIVDSVFSTNL